MEKRLKRIGNWFTRDRIAIVGGIACLVLLLMMEGFAIAVAVVAHNYVALSVFTYIVIAPISQFFINEKPFKKVVKTLLKKQYTSNVVFFVVGLITTLLSWKYFVAFLLCILQAILYGQYCRAKEEFN